MSLPPTQILETLAGDRGGKIVLLVLDGVGDIRTAEQPRTPLEAAYLPNLHALAARASLGRLLPAGWGITPGSGPGHLALFGYDPLLPEHQIGRGVLEALGLGLECGPGEVVARANFATADEQGRLIDRRAGRLPTSEGTRIVAALNAALDEAGLGLRARLFAGEAHRAVLQLKGEGLSAAVEDTDPQELGVPPLPPRPSSPEGQATAELVQQVLQIVERVLASEPKANRLLLRGFSQMPHLWPFPERFHLRAGAFAGYPLYRGVARACGMEVVPVGKEFREGIEAVEASWERFDFFFLHVKATDQAGEDGNFSAKVAALEAVDRELPRLLALAPEVLAVTGDHSTPVPMKAHSFHPVPLLLAAKTAFQEGVPGFTERLAARGYLGTLLSRDLMGLLLAHAGRLEKFGA
jgi:2,3-bisphosphoglycerate-independent phosphoglycerate mutase